MKMIKIIKNGKAPFVKGVLLCAAAALAFSACSKKNAAAGKSGAFTDWTDSARRVVRIPEKPERIAPSGGLAQIVLYTLCPDKIMGLSGRFTDTQKKYFPEKYWDLPVFGQFYGTADLNMEAIVEAKPDLIIDIGEAKASIKEDLDSIQERTGLPVIFVEAVLETMPEAYRTLGRITGEAEAAETLARYVEDTLQYAKEKRGQIPEDKRVRVYYGGGKAGQQANVRGSIHADVLDYVGAVNVADIAQKDGRGMDEVPMEQIIIWNPDVVLFPAGSVYDTVQNDKAWLPVSAVRTGRFYEIPSEPYNWLGRPPSVHRVLGIKWLGNLLYPDVFDCNIVSETQKFFKLFYHCDISEEDVRTLLAKSTFRK